MKTETKTTDKDISVMRTQKEPEPFTYLGKEFTPVISNRKYSFEELSKKVWGGGVYLQALQEINDKFRHEDFYKEAKKAGCGKIDVFTLEGEKVIPCNRLMYYGEPTWYTNQQEEIAKAKAERTKGEFMYSKHGNNESYGIYTSEYSYDICIVKGRSQEQAEANAAYICEAVNGYDALKIGLTEARDIIYNLTSNKEYKINNIAYVEKLQEENKRLREALQMVGDRIEKISGGELDHCSLSHNDCQKIKQALK